MTDPKDMTREDLEAEVARLRAPATSPKQARDMTLEELNRFQQAHGLRLTSALSHKRAAKARERR